MTAYRRRMRLHQARWRERHGHPIGSQPIVPRAGKPSQPVGSRLPLDYARETGATFATSAALEAARARTAYAERHQSFDHQRLWADLLWAPALALNLFGDLAADHALADRAVHAWWPDTPGVVREVRFAHSPGRLDGAFLGNLVDWDVAFVLDPGDGTEAVLGVVTAYVDVNRRQPPKPERLPRYREVSERSEAFAPGWLDAVNGTELIHIWLEHALVLASLQHPSERWSWGRLVVVHPAGNMDFADACSRYRALLLDAATFASSTVEDLLDAGVLPETTVAALRERYLPD
jgi:hypothetical protein